MALRCLKNDFKGRVKMGFRNLLYKLARWLGDIQAAGKGKVGRRIGRRLAGKATGRCLGKIFK